MPIKTRRALGSKPKPATLNPQLAKKLSITKRKPNSTKLVYTDGDVLVVKTPAACTHWTNEFRLRVVASYVAPKTVKSREDFERSFVSNGYQNEVYRVQGKRVMVRQVTEDIHGPYLVVLRTEVIDLTACRKMFLYHQDPAMRILMIYSFLTDTPIAGVPQFDISEYDNGLR